MRDWKDPGRAFGSDDEAVRWWLLEHFRPSSSVESRGVEGMALYASYLAAAVRHRALPLITGTMFGRIAGATVGKGRVWDGHTIKVAYLVEPADGVDVVRPPPDEEKRGPIFMARHLMAEAAKKRAGVDDIWKVRAAENEADRKVVLSFLDKKMDRNPTLETGRRALSLSPEPDPLLCEEVASKSLWDQFPKNGWTYIKFLTILGQVAIVKRTSTRRIAVLERKVAP